MVTRPEQKNSHIMLLYYSSLNAITYKSFKYYFKFLNSKITK